MLLSSNFSDPDKLSATADVAGPLILLTRSDVDSLSAGMTILKPPDLCFLHGHSHNVKNP